MKQNYDTRANNLDFGPVDEISILHEVLGERRAYDRGTGRKLKDVHADDITVIAYDVEDVAGVYPVRPQVPAIGGYEGVGEVYSVGSAVKGLSPGVLVIPSPPSFVDSEFHMFTHKIATFENAACFQALIQFSDAEIASSARNALDGRSRAVLDFEMLLIDVYFLSSMVFSEAC
uniref:Alcohol dehydrogenase-like N-terminal domain-containing protein n=1 Tax=Cannabis sativa TaxID=3483 RepID=A0A803Q6H1_CANSA